MSNIDRVAIVTGGSRGIGAAISRRLARDGFAIVVNYAGNEKAAVDTVNEIVATGARAVAIKADVSHPDEVQSLFEQSISTFGGVDVLVNNAGIFKMSLLAEADDRHIDSHIDINIKGSIYTMREAAKHLRNGGRIVNFSTSVVGTKFENYGVYAATKAAVETLTAIMAKELRGRSITVNAVAPGPTATELFFDGKSEELIERLAKANPLERLGEPDDIANVVAFLVGPDGGWINGQTIRANGGMV